MDQTQALVNAFSLNMRAWQMGEPKIISPGIVEVAFYDLHHALDFVRVTEFLSRGMVDQLTGTIQPPIVPAFEVLIKTPGDILVPNQPVTVTFTLKGDES